MKEYEYLGIAMSWEETFEKAKEIFCENKFEAMVTLSKKEFESGNYVSIMLKEYYPMFYVNNENEEECLEQILVFIAQFLYTGNTKFQMALRKNLKSYTPTGLKDISIFVVIYLKEDEELIKF